MVVKLRKGIRKNFENCKFEQNHAKIQDINIVRTISLSQETLRCPCFKPERVSQADKDPYTWNMIKNFPKT